MPRPGPATSLAGVRFSRIGPVGSLPTLPLVVNGYAVHDVDDLGQVEVVPALTRAALQVFGKLLGEAAQEAGDEVALFDRHGAAVAVGDRAETGTDGTQ